MAAFCPILVIVFWEILLLYLWWYYGTAIQSSMENKGRALPELLKLVVIFWGVIGEKVLFKAFICGKAYWIHFQDSQSIQKYNLIHEFIFQDKGIYALRVKPYFSLTLFSWFAHLRATLLLCTVLAGTLFYVTQCFSIYSFKTRSECALGRWENTVEIIANNYLEIAYCSMSDTRLT